MNLMRRKRNLLFILIMVVVSAAGCSSQKKMDAILGGPSDFLYSSSAAMEQGMVYEKNGYIFYLTEDAEEKEVAAGDLKGVSGDYIYYEDQDVFYAKSLAGEPERLEISGVDASVLGQSNGNVLLYGEGKLYVAPQEHPSQMMSYDLGGTLAGASYLWGEDFYWIRKAEEGFDLCRTKLSGGTAEVLAHMEQIGTEKTSALQVENCLYIFADYDIYCYTPENGKYFRVWDFPEQEDKTNAAFWNGKAYVGCYSEGKTVLRIYDLKQQQLEEEHADAGNPEVNEYGISYLQGRKAIVARIGEIKTISLNESGLENVTAVMPTAEGIAIKCKEEMVYATEEGEGYKLTKAEFEESDDPTPVELNETL